MFDITKITQPTIKEMWAGLEDYLIEKYQKPGIYCIKINNKIVYIGKSIDMLGRMYDHMRSIENPHLTKTQKYNIIRVMKGQGYKISFDVLQDCSEMTVDELGECEGGWIRKYMPLLNTQIPHLGDYKHWETKKCANYDEVRRFVDEGKFNGTGLDKNNS